MPIQDAPTIHIPGDFYNPGPDDNPIFMGRSLTGQSRQTLTVTDLICEGPIQGLVDGPFSIFLNDDRAVPDTETTLTTADGPISVAVTNGSTAATISDNAPDDLILEAEGDKYLILKNIGGPVLVTLVNAAGDSRVVSVVGGASSILASYLLPAPKDTGRYLCSRALSTSSSR